MGKKTICFLVFNTKHIYMVIQKNHKVNALPEHFSFFFSLQPSSHMDDLFAHSAEVWSASLPRTSKPTHVYKNHAERFQPVRAAQLTGRGPAWTESAGVGGDPSPVRAAELDMKSPTDWNFIRVQKAAFLLTFDLTKPRVMRQCQNKHRCISLSISPYY